MIEQRRNGASYITVYRGTRAELFAAGVPAEAFPTNTASLQFKLQTINVCSSGSHELLDATMRTDGVCELEVEWTYVTPYAQAAHPAVCELARMLLKDVIAWTDTLRQSEEPDLTRPFARLAVDERAVDFKPVAGAPAFQVSPEFHRMLVNEANRIYSLVHTYGEVSLAPSGPASGDRSGQAARKAGMRPTLRLVRGA